MLEIKKIKTEFGYSFTILTNQGSFHILYAGNLDLYWSYIPDGSILKQTDTKSFIINKENYFLFSLFETLYNKVKECKPFEITEVDYFCCETLEDVKLKKQEIQKLNKNFKEQQQYNPNRLFKNNIIEWHSDDCEYDYTSKVKIKKLNESYLITFEKSKKESGCYTYSVRFTNSGSRYEHFNQVFMKMYIDLINYEEDYHQIHIEEYLYQKKLEKRYNK